MQLLSGGLGRRCLRSIRKRMKPMPWSTPNSLRPGRTGPGMSHKAHNRKRISSSLAMSLALEREWGHFSLNEIESIRGPGPD